MISGPRLWSTGARAQKHFSGLFWGSSALESLHSDSFGGQKGAKMLQKGPSRGSNVEVLRCPSPKGVHLGAEWYRGLGFGASGREPRNIFGVCSGDL